MQDIQGVRHPCWYYQCQTQVDVLVDFETFGFRTKPQLCYKPKAGIISKFCKRTIFLAFYIELVTSKFRCIHIDTPSYLCPLHPNKEQNSGSGGKLSEMTCSENHSSCHCFLRASTVSCSSGDRRATVQHQTLLQRGYF